MRSGNLLPDFHGFILICHPLMTMLNAHFSLCQINFSCSPAYLYWICKKADPFCQERICMDH